MDQSTRNNRVPANNNSTNPTDVIPVTARTNTNSTNAYPNRGNRTNRTFRTTTNETNTNRTNPNPDGSTRNSNPNPNPTRNSNLNPNRTTRNRLTRPRRRMAASQGPRYGRHGYWGYLDASPPLADSPPPLEYSEPLSHDILPFLLPDVSPRQSFERRQENRRLEELLEAIRMERYTQDEGERQTGHHTTRATRKKRKRARQREAGGYPDTLFIDISAQDREDLQCNICFHIPRTPVHCPNKHLFCAVCIYHWSISCAECRSMCPVCRTYGRYLPAPIPPKLQRQTVHCVYDDCEWGGVFLDYKQHETLKHKAELVVDSDGGGGSSSSSGSDSDTERARERPLSSDRSSSNSGYSIGSAELALFPPILRDPSLTNTNTIQDTTGATAGTRIGAGANTGAGAGANTGARGGIRGAGVRNSNTNNTIGTGRTGFPNTNTGPDGITTDAGALRFRPSNSSDNVDGLRLTLRQGRARIQAMMAEVRAEIAEQDRNLDRLREEREQRQRENLQEIQQIRTQMGDVSSGIMELLDDININSRQYHSYIRALRRGQRLPELARNIDRDVSEGRRTLNRILDRTRNGTQNGTQNGTENGTQDSSQHNSRHHHQRNRSRAQGQPRGPVSYRAVNVLPAVSQSADMLTSTTQQGRNRQQRRRGQSVSHTPP